MSETLKEDMFEHYQILNRIIRPDMLRKKGYSMFSRETEYLGFFKVDKPLPRRCQLQMLAFLILFDTFFWSTSKIAGTKFVECVSLKFLKDNSIEK